MASNSATQLATQQSIKAYVDAEVAGVVDSAPAALDTLNELAAALGDDANFSTTTSTALGNRLRVDTASQGLTGTQQANAITNLGITATKAELNYVDGVTSAIQTQLDGKQATGSYLTGNQTITLSGDVSGSGTTSIAVTIADDSHNHVISNVDGLQTALDAKLASSSYTASDVLTKIKTVDGAGSGLDADLLDGISSASFLRSDAADSWNIGRGDVYIEDNSADNPSGAGITLRTSSNPSSGDPASVGNIFAIRSSGQALRFAVGQSITSTGDNDFTTNGLTANGNITVTGTVDGRDIASDGSKLDGIESGATADQSASEILTLIKTVDGASSGLDADLLDGQSSAYYATASSVTALAALDPIITLTGAVTGTGTMTNLGNVTIATTATADPTLTLSGDASGSATFTNLGNATLSVTVADNSHNHSSSSGDFTVNGGNLYTGTSQQRVKLAVWNGATYGIGMGSGYTFGGIANEYVLSNQMSNTDGRGFWWGDSSHTNAQGAMALTTHGYLTVANRIRVGYGESDTTTPAATLDVNGTIKLDGNYPTGTENVALGNTALDSVSTGARNVAIGTNAGTAISSGTDNTAVGMNALASVTTGLTNTAVGRNSLYSNTGSNNTGLGYYALFANTTGGYNTSVGRNALDANTTASFNTAVGYNSLGVNTTGTKNVAFGASAGESCTSGSRNVFIGESAGFDATDATNNVFIGFETQNDNAGTGSQVVIGHKARSQGGGKFTVGTSNTTYSHLTIGGTSWSGSSDERLKKEITNSNAGLSFINDLRPVTFKWKTKGEVDSSLPHYEEGSNTPVIGDSDTNSLTKHGFIAQEVKTVLDNHPEVKDGADIWEENRDEIQNFAPTALIPMLVKALQEADDKIDALTTRIEALEG
jgi:hypothetical protein